MKKIYLQPAIFVTCVSTTTMVAASPVGPKVSEDKLDAGVDALTRERGDWDIWGE